MRQTGIEIFYWLQNWSDDQTSCFAKAKDLGFDAVEISLTSGPDTPIAQMRSELDHLGLSVYASLGLPLEKDITSPDASVRQSGIEYLKRCVEAASRLGSPILGGLPHVPWLHFPAERDLRPFRERSAVAMREVAQVASDQGITLCIELINRFETYICNTVEQGVEYLALVDHPAVKLQLDTYHMSMEEDDLAAAILAAGPKLGHFHCAESNRKLPGGGQVRWQVVKQALDATAYRGPLVIECFPNPNAETGRTVNTWRPLVKDPDADLARALALLRREVA
ncbi:MAG: sugar phosphate isomerase/epimerase [Chloroflexi bacterium]|uniref:sugar phosphate isomerase/epimerase family protein n=1 Tax=Candidatus Flexifilum breve TaxID=3140694 RepID=UPI003135DBA9|nr:sugar phosphate isomerase/epimerase [Chloroflexota bacterium]